jgi:hypothetical protein
MRELNIWMMSDRGRKERFFTRLIYLSYVLHVRARTAPEA